MNTIIIEHADKSTTELLKRLAEQLGLSFKIKKERKEPGIVTNPELLRRMEAVENGTAELIDMSIDELRKLTHA